MKRRPREKSEDSIAERPNNLGCTKHPLPLPGDRVQGESAKEAEESTVQEMARSVHQTVVKRSTVSTDLPTNIRVRSGGVEVYATLEKSVKLP